MTPVSTGEHTSAMKSERPSEVPWHCQCEFCYHCDCAAKNPCSQIGPVGRQTLHRKPVRTSRAWETQGIDSASPLDPPSMSLHGRTDTQRRLDFVENV